MQINLSALSAGNTENSSIEKDQRAILDYPKSEPILESSYIFPKVESNGGWKFAAPGVISISTDC